MNAAQRRSGFALAMVGAAVLGLSCSCGDEKPAKRRETPSADSELASDERIALLLAPAAVRHGVYDVDLSDPTQVLVEILLHGDHDPLKRAKAELAAMGDKGVDAIRRVIEQYQSDPGGIDYLRNAMDVLALGETRASYDLLASLLDHPLESLRIQALRGLKRRGRPEDYDRVHDLMKSASDVFVAEIALTLAQFDAVRARVQYLDWVEAGELEPLWDSALPIVAGGGPSDGESPEVLERCRRLTASDLAPRYALWLEGPLAKSGDARALERLRARLADPDPSLRDIAQRTLTAAGRVEELAKTLLDDPRPGVRLVAAHAVEGAPDSELTRELLARGANDENADVRQVCLEALARRGERSAIDLGQSLLANGTPPDLEAGARILSNVWDRDRAVAERAFEELRRQFLAQSKRPLQQNKELLKCVGRLPMREAAQFLLDLAAPWTAPEQRAEQRWVVLQIANGGPDAQKLLSEELPKTSDPELRLDMIEALSSPSGPLARSTLLAIASDPATNALELLYIADRLARMGPVAEVAWQLKRAALQRPWTPAEQPARQALTDLLWRWFPGPR
jgi:HEAT repeat protein